MFGIRLKELRTEYRYTQEALGEKLSVSDKTIGAWERGTREPPMKAIKTLAELFDVSIDYLMGSTDKRHYYSLTEKDNKDIEAEIEEILNGMTQSNSVNFFKSNPDLTDRDRELLEVSLRQSLALAREMAKKKFTPKKYRGSESD